MSYVNISIFSHFNKCLIFNILCERSRNWLIFRYVFLIGWNSVFYANRNWKPLIFKDLGISVFRKLLIFNKQRLLVREISEHV